MTRYLIIAAFWLASCGQPARPASSSRDDAEDEAVDETQWTLLWSDEFDGERDALPEPARWGFEVGGDGWGNDQLEYDSDRAENAATDGKGHLRIVARREPLGGREYTSARLSTRGRLTLTYGRVEARLRLPGGQGVWPAFWMLGDNIDQVGWPECGEIDIMEHRGQDEAIVRGSLHGPEYSGAQNIGAPVSVAGGDLHDSFHVFGVIWDAAKISWYVDDYVYQEVLRDQMPAKARWVFDHPHFILLNLAIGGGFVGSPDASTPFPATMLVDYVRVYRRAS